MFWRHLGVFLLVTVAAAAQAQGETRYVSDEIAIVLREAPRPDAGSRGVVTSGARVAVLESGPSGYVRVRAADGREGWMLERHLKKEPAARDRLLRAEQALAAAQAENKALRQENERLQQDLARVAGGEPIASRELMEEAEHLRSQLAQKEADVTAAREAQGATRAMQRTLLIGGGLVAAGALLALLVRLLWPKRRWSDF